MDGTDDYSCSDNRTSRFVAWPTDEFLSAAPNQRLQLTGCARVMMWLSVCSPLPAGGRQLSLLR